MNRKEVIEYFKTISEDHSKAFYDAIQYCDISKDAIHNFEQESTAYDMAIKSLEKQLPKEPYKDEYGCFRCRYCNYAVEYEAQAKGGLMGVCRDNYCSNCGQAIDWSEEE